MKALFFWMTNICKQTFVRNLSLWKDSSMIETEFIRDQNLCSGIRLVHFGCYEDAAERLSEASEEDNFCL